MLNRLLLYYNMWYFHNPTFPQEGCQDFESMAWYEAVMFYGFQEDVKLDNNDSDIKLVPSLVEKVLLPKLTGIITILPPVTWEPCASG